MYRFVRPCRLCARLTALDERADALDSLPRSQRIERRGEPRAVGQGQLGVELEQRDEHEPAARQLGVRNGEPLALQLEVAEQQDVEVDRPRSVTRAGESPALLDLDCLADAEQLLW